MTYQYDFLIIGAGLAGMSYALKVAEGGHGKVCIICKTPLDEANGLTEPGEMDAVTSFDEQQLAQHVQATLLAGEGLSNGDVVRKVMDGATRRMQSLHQWAQDGSQVQSCGSAILHQMAEKLRLNEDVDIKENHFAVELITQHHLGMEVTRRTAYIECYGAYVLNPVTQQVDTYLSKVTMVCTGGCGAVYQSTTNTTVATGDGVAMVYRAKGTVTGMEFVQFYPTTLYLPNETHPAYPVDETLRQNGAVLRLVSGETFMEKYDGRGSKATGDIVARAIDKELKMRGEPFLYLDATQLDADLIHNQYEALYQKCLLNGIDITTDPIPVRPAEHYMCGGIQVDEHGESSIHRLYAIGECASTGLHGANRLPDNSFYETLFYVEAAAKHALSQISRYEVNVGIPQWDDSGTMSNEEHILITQSIREVGEVMTNYVGIVRSDLRLKRAWDRLDLLYEETESLFKKVKASREICELRDMVNVGYLITRQAIERKESRGLHYTLDYPNHGYD